MQDKELERLMKLIAGSRSCRDVIALLEKLSNIVCDVRKEIPGGGSVESRKAADAILHSAIDGLKGIRKNEERGTLDENDDDQ